MSLLKKLRNQKLQKAVAVSVLALGFGISNDVSAYKNPYSDNAVYTGNSTVVVGSEAEALEKAGATAVGYQASASNSGTAVGAYSNASQDGTAVGYRANASGTDSIAIGDTVNNATAIMSIALGFDSDATEVGAIVLGARSSATAEDAIAIGKDTEANYNSAIAVGADSFANAAGSVVIGTNAGISSSGVSSVAVGGFSRAYGTHSLALGSGADSSADYSVAIGSNSEASEAYTVSFGSGETKRRLVNVAAGTAQTDAVNVSQLISKGSYNAETKQLSLQSNSGSNVLVDLSALPEGGAAYTAGDGIIIADDVISVKKDGTVTEGNTDVVTGGTVYDAVKNKADITYIDAELANKADTDLGNITDGGKGVVGDIAEEALADDLNAKANVNASNVAGFTAEWGAAIGTGIVEDGNRQLVSGGTVFNAVKDKADITYVDAGLSNKVDLGLGNINIDGRNVIQNIAKGSVKLANGTNTTVSSSENEDGSLTYKVHVEGSGQAEAGNTGLVSGDTLYNTVNNISNNFTEITDDINAELAVKANADASNVAGFTAEWGAAIGTGIIEDGNGQLVTGGTVFNAVKDKADITYVDNGLLSKADADLGNLTAGGQSVIQNIAKGSVKLENGINTTVSSTENEDGSLTYKVNVEGSGKAEAGNTGLVSGDTLYNTVNEINENITNVTEGINADLNNKADANASNVADHTAEWGAAIGTGLVEDGNSELVTDDTVYEAVKDKADADLGNLTEDGKDVIKNIAQNSVKVEDGLNTTVTRTENEDGSLTYKVNVEGSGKAEAGNTGLISGDTLYNTVNEINENITNVTEGINAELDGKADADASNVADHTAEWGAAIGTGKVEAGNGELVTGNTVYEAVKDKADADFGNLTEDGKGVIGDIAQDALQDDLDGKANTDASNIETDKWADKLGTGTIADGDKSLVNGDTVYDAIKNMGGGLVMSDDKTITVGKNDGAAVIDVARQNSDGSTENRVITGVQTDSEDMSSAANVGYVNQSVGQLASDFNRGLSELDNQMKKGVAGAAALAALNPLDYDPENKLNFAAGVGSYKGENATALGMFYRPNENVMFSLGGAFGNGENMWNAGITFNLDKPSTSTSKAAMARAIKTMAADNDALEAKAAEQDAKIAQLTAQVQALLEAQGINK